MHYSSDTVEIQSFQVSNLLSRNTLRRKWDAFLLCESVHHQPVKWNSYNWASSPPNSILPTWKDQNTSLILQMKSSTLGQGCQQFYLNSQGISIITFSKVFRGPILLSHFINSQRQWKTMQMSLIIIFFCLSMLWEKIKGRRKRKRWNIHDTN